MGLNIKDATVIVTGGAGFLGSHLTKELLANQVKVIVFDNEINSKSIFKLENLSKTAKLEKVNVCDKAKVLTLFKKYKPDYVIHLAAEPIVQNAYDQPYNAFDTNIMGTVSILEAARIFGNVKGIIVASTDKAYGKSSKSYKEDYPLRGDHPYDASKACADLISQSYIKTYDMPIVITRFGNIYGEGDFHFGRIIPDICRAIIKKSTLDIRSDGSYVRDYLYVKDVVDGYILLLQRIKQVKGEAFNFSSKDSFSVLDLIKKAEEITNSPINYKILNIAKNEIPYQRLNDAKIKKFGWRNNFNISSTLPQIIKWYNEIL